MTRRFSRAAAVLLCGGLLALVAVSDALASHSATWLVGILALKGVDATVTRDGAVVGHARSDDKGNLVVTGLAPGDYVIAIDGKSLSSALDKLAPATPADRDSGPSVGLGVGGVFGGGHSDHDGHGAHGGSGGGVGLGVNIPLGGGDQGSGPQDNPITSINISLPANPDMAGSTTDWGSGVRFELPYCRDSAGQGVRIGFTVPAGPARSVNVTMTIFDRWGNL